MSGYVPARGDAVWLDFDPQAGHERAGHRPAVVLSPQLYNGRSGLAIVCPVTTREKGYPFEIVLPTGLPVTGAVLSDQARNVDWQARRATFICALPESVVTAILNRLHRLL